MLLICDMHENVKVQVGQGDPKTVSKITIIVCVCVRTFFNDHYVIVSKLPCLQPTGHLHPLHYHCFTATQ